MIDRATPNAPRGLSPWPFVVVVAAPLVVFGIGWVAQSITVARMGGTLAALALDPLVLIAAVAVGFLRLTPWWQFAAKAIVAALTISIVASIIVSATLIVDAESAFAPHVVALRAVAALWIAHLVGLLRVWFGRG